jgi:general nucleoside transport system permease protein
MRPRLTNLLPGGTVGVFASVLAALAILGIILLLGGYNPIAVLATLGRGGWGSMTSVSETFVRATPILLCAAAAALPGRLGLVNIGGEGQFLVGAVAASWIALTFDHLPGGFVLPLMAGASFLLGAVWGLIPGGLRAWTRTSETVVSLLLNYVASFWLLHLIHGPWKNPNGLGWAETRAFSESALLRHLPGTRIHIMLAVALGIVLIIAVILKHTIWGFAARVIEASPETARYAGISDKSYFIFTFFIAGGLAGLAGFGEIAGVQGRLREGVSLGYGYVGFLVAWLCRNRFAWLPVASILLGGLLAGGDVLQVSAGLPFATINILQGLLFLAVLVQEALRQRSHQSSAEVAS